MSDTIDVSRIQGFADSVHHISQQDRSLLEGKVRVRPGKGKVEYFERLSPSNMLQVTTRHGDTVWNDINHSRRAAFKADYSWSQPVDEEDQLELLIDPVGEYAMAAGMAVGRRIDQTIVDAISGTANTGEAGAGTQVLPAGQTLNAGGTTGLTMALMAQGLQRLYDRGVIVNPLDFTYVHSPNALRDILEDSGATAFTSTDFTNSNVMKAGVVREFMGFSWIMMPDKAVNTETGILPIVESTDRIGTYMFHRNGVGLAVWNRVSASIDKRPDKNNTTQVLVKTHIGAVRIEDELVIEILVDNSES